MTVVHSVYVDWDGDGDFDSAAEDVTGRVFGADRGQVTIQYGRDQARTLSPISPGQATFEVDNASRDYSPENTSSPLAGDLKPGRAVLMQSTLDGTTYSMFRGQLDDYRVSPEVESRSVEFSCLDALAALREVKLSTPLHQGVRTGEAVGLILDAAGWPAGLRDIDAGATTIRWWWEEGTDAFEALRKVAASEGPPAIVFIAADGSFSFRDRHHRLLRAASTTSQATLHATTEPAMSGMTYDHGWRDVVNSVSISVAERDPASELSNVWQDPGILAVSDGETKLVKAQSSDPFFGAVAPEAGVDYTLRSGTVTITLSRTSGGSATLFVKATGGPAEIEGLALRAYPVSVSRTVQVVAEDPSSIVEHGPKSLPNDFDPVWAGVADAAAIADLVLAQRAQRLPTIQVRMTAGNDLRHAQMLARDLSDRVRILDPETGLDADFWIEQISHTLTGPGAEHESVLGCEKVPDTPSNVFRFDVAGRGFDDGVFGAQGLDDPDLIFRFDTAGQGFDDGVFAT